jgi:hypothetical protein
MRKPRLTILTFIVGAAWLLSATPASAAPTAFGIRGGVTNDVDAIFFGGHVSIAPSSVRNLIIQPSLELGIGDDDYDIDFFFLRGNLHFMFMIPLSSDAAFYPLFGPSMHYVDWDDGYEDTEVGLNLGMGLEFSSIALELIFGLPQDNLPDITLAISYTFW